MLAFSFTHEDKMTTVNIHNFISLVKHIDKIENELFKKINMESKR